MDRCLAAGGGTIAKEGKPVWHGSNQMILFHLVQVIYLMVIFSLWGWIGLAFGPVRPWGILLLETINYIETTACGEKRGRNYEKVCNPGTAGTVIMSWADLSV